MIVDLILLAAKVLVGGWLSLFVPIIPQVPLVFPVHFVLSLLTSSVQVFYLVRGWPAKGSPAHQRLLYFTYGRLALLGPLAFVVDFPVLVLGLLGIMALQTAGVVRKVPFSYNTRNLVVRWRTTLLTALAFTLVVALMTVMLAFVNGMYALTKSSGVPGNVIVLADGATDEIFSDLGYGDIDLLETHPYIKTMRVRSNGRDIETPMVSWELFQVVNQPIPNAPPNGKQRRFVQLRGLEDPVVSAAVHDLKLYPGGGWFDAGAGAQAGTGPYEGEQLIQAVVGEGLAREMGPDQGKRSLEVGDVFEMGPRHWVIVGIMQSAGKTFDSEVWAKRKLVGEMFRKDKRSTAVVRLKDGLDPTTAAKELTANFKNPAINARTEADYFESLNGTNQQFLVAIVLVALFMAIGGVFGVMNTMFAAIAQRTRDIGVLRILGFSRWQILVSFFLESLLLALVGGLLGCALGSLCNGWTATSIAGSGQGGGKSVVLKLVVDARILGAGMAFSLAMGCIGGLLPALSAIRLKPLDALR